MLKNLMEQKDYVIVKRGNEWCLMTRDRTKTLGCHPTKKEAEAQERAIQAQKHKQETFNIYDVEIFRAGTHNGDKYTIEDLDEIVKASKEVGFIPPLKKGHSEESGQPALGWVENIRRVDSKLIADFIDLPEAVYEAILNRRYDTVSAEIYWNLEREGKVYPRVLKAVALLGAEIPAIDLEPLHEALNVGFSELQFELIRNYHTNLITSSEDVIETIQFSFDDVKKLCPSYADEMQKQNLTSIECYVVKVEKGYQLRMPQALINALCERFSPSEGFRTRCMASSLGQRVANAGAFCNALKWECDRLGLLCQKGEPKIYEEEEMPNIEELLERAIPESNEEKEALIKELKQAIQDLMAQIVELQIRQHTEKGEEGRKENTKIAEIQQKLDETNRRLEELSAMNRIEQIEKKVAKLKIPSLRPFARSFYEVALEMPQIVKFSISNDEKVDMPFELVVDRWVDAVNRTASLMYTEISRNEILREEGIPETFSEISDEVHRRVMKYISDKKLDSVKDYSTALRYVLDSDPSLKVAYTQVRS